MKPLFPSPYLAAELSYGENRGRGSRDFRKADRGGRTFEALLRGMHINDHTRSVIIETKRARKCAQFSLP
jgi:hypothetical protein